jgi:hypothetical protein
MNAKFRKVLNPKPNTQNPTANFFTAEPQRTPSLRRGFRFSFFTFHFPFFQVAPTGLLMFWLPLYYHKPAPPGLLQNLPTIAANSPSCAREIAINYLMKASTPLSLRNLFSQTSP